MKSVRISIGIMMFIFVVSLSVSTVSTHAELIDNFDGTVTQHRVDGSSLLWLKDADYAKTSGYDWDGDGRMSWWQANDWIASLNASNHLGYNDWRLPDVSPVNGVSYDYTNERDGSSDLGYNISAPDSAYPDSIGSEMAYMFYVELGNLGFCNIYGSCEQPGYGLSNSGPFINLMADHGQYHFYWSGTEYFWDGNVEWPTTNKAWFFRFANGFQGYSYK